MYNKKRQQSFIVWGHRDIEINKCTEAFQNASKSIPQMLLTTFIFS